MSYALAAHSSESKMPRYVVFFWYLNCATHALLIFCHDTPRKREMRSGLGGRRGRRPAESLGVGDEAADTASSFVSPDPYVCSAEGDAAVAAGMCTCESTETRSPSLPDDGDGRLAGFRLGELL